MEKMNRDKKQLIVVGVLVVLILSVGAFQFLRKTEAPPPAPSKKEVKVTKDNEKATKAKDIKNPQFGPLNPKDPFEIAAFVAGPPDPVIVPQPVKKPDIGGTKIPEISKTHIKELPFGNDSNSNTVLPPGGGVPPMAPPEPKFEYSLIGIVEGKHPMAVFDDGKGNQQLVEAGQSVGPSATVIAISRGKVRVQFNARTLVFNVGGNPNAK
jgi:hypothetical protein